MHWFGLDEESTFWCLDGYFCIHASSIKSRRLNYIGCVEGITFGVLYISLNCISVIIRVLLGCLTLVNAFCVNLTFSGTFVMVQEPFFLISEHKLTWRFDLKYGP